MTVKGERKFEWDIQLPMPVRADKVKATYRDGMLEIKLPKVEEVRPKQIKKREIGLWRR